MDICQNKLLLLLKAIAARKPHIIIDGRQELIPILKRPLLFFLNLILLMLLLLVSFLLHRLYIQFDVNHYLFRWGLNGLWLSHGERNRHVLLLFFHLFFLFYWLLVIWLRNILLIVLMGEVDKGHSPVL